MKKILLFIAFIVSATAIWAQPQKIAILDIVDKEMQVSYNTKLMLRSYIQDAISQSAAGETLDCADLSGIIDEYEFSRSRQLSAEDVRNIGQSCAAEKILVVEVSQPKVRQLFVMAKLYNTSTGNIEKTANAMIKEKAETMQTGAKELVFTLLIQPSSTNGAIAKTTSNETSMDKASKEELIPLNFNKIERDGLSYMLFNNGQYVGTMERKAYINFIKHQQDREAWMQYKQDKLLTDIGWSVFSLGIVTMCLGAGFAAGVDEGITLGLSVIPLATGISLLSVGYTRINRNHEIYNKSHAEKPALTFNLQSSANGIGLALYF